MATTAPVGIGIIGTGTIAQAHLQSLQGFALARVVTLYDIVPERAQATAQRFGVPHVARTLEEVLEHPEVQAVIVCTPPAAHAAPTIAALEAGKHVLVEKPFALDTSEAERMVRTAERAGRFLACASARYRYTPAQQKARAMIDRGDLGEVYHVRWSQWRFRGRPGHHVFPQSRWFLAKAQAGGGVIMDFAVYMLDSVLWLLGNPKVLSVTAQIRQLTEVPPPPGVQQDVEDHAVLMLQCAGGRSAIVETAWVANMRLADGLYVFGTRAGLRFEPLTRITAQPVPPEDRPPLPFLGEEVYRPVEEQVFPYADVGALGRGADVTRPFVEGIIAGREPYTPGRDALVVTQVIEAAYRSAQTQTAVSLASPA